MGCTRHRRLQFIDHYARYDKSCYDTLFSALPHPLSLIRAVADHKPHSRWNRLGSHMCSVDMKSARWLRMVQMRRIVQQLWNPRGDEPVSPRIHHLSRTLSKQLQDGPSEPAPCHDGIRKLTLRSLLLRQEPNCLPTTRLEENVQRGSIAGLVSCCDSCQQFDLVLCHRTGQRPGLTMKDYKDPHFLTCRYSPKSTANASRSTISPRCLWWLHRGLPEESLLARCLIIDCTARRRFGHASLAGFRLGICRIRRGGLERAGSRE